MINEIIQGDALTKLRELESESVDCCITSPPYWALRDYKTEGQLGLEPTFNEYIAKLIQIFNEVKRVLKKSGACWVNMGDTYSQLSIRHRNGQGERPPDTNFIVNERMKQPNTIIGNRIKQDVPEKSLCLIPQRFQIAMIDAGWICRNTIIWYKPNCMPSSAHDRFTVNFEYLFFFVKNPRYYFETQYEAYDGPLNRWGGKIIEWKPDSKARSGVYFNNDKPTFDSRPNPLGRIKRCVWKIPTQPFSDAHFAVFPPAIVETPLKATCPQWICRKCGKPREAIYERTAIENVSIKEICVSCGNSYSKHTIGEKNLSRNNGIGPPYTTSIEGILFKPCNTDRKIGLSDCGCNAGFDGGIVLDPFIGSGTVALVAMQNARNFVGIELNPDYIKMAMERLEPYLKQERITAYE